MILKNIILSLFIFVGIVSADNSVKTKVQDVSPQQLEKQNTQLTKLVAKELSESLPAKIDKYTTCTKVISKGAGLIYIFEINSDKTDEQIKNEDKTRMRTAVIRGICTRSKRFMEAKINIIYRYISGKSKAKLFEFKATEQVCKPFYN